MRCTQCDHALRGLALDGACPGCGTPVARSTQPAYLTQWGTNDLVEAPDVFIGASGVLRFLVRTLVPFVAISIIVVAIFMFVIRACSMAAGVGGP